MASKGRNDTGQTDQEAHRRKTTRKSSANFEARRNEIVRLAAKLFARYGYHATSMAQLEEATGLGRGALYHYIGSKEELLFYIHEQFINPLLTETEKILQEHLAAEEALRAFSRTLMREIANYRDEVTVFFHEWRSFTDHSLWEVIREKRRSFERILATILDRGIQEGVFEIANKKLAILAFLGMYNYSYQWLNVDGPSTPQEIADTFCNLFLEGVKVAGGTTYRSQQWHNSFPEAAKTDQHSEQGPCLIDEG